MRFLDCPFCARGQHLTWQAAEQCRRDYFANQAGRKAGDRLAKRLSDALPKGAQR